MILCLLYECLPSNNIFTPLYRAKCVDILGMISYINYVDAAQQSKQKQVIADR
jgi:hypothetical protein